MSIRAFVFVGAAALLTGCGAAGTVSRSHHASVSHRPSMSAAEVTQICNDVNALVPNSDKSGHTSLQHHTLG
jgi:hypothetical protein